MEYSLLTYLYLDLWVNKKPVELYYCIQSPGKNEKFYPSPIEDLSVKIEKVRRNRQNGCSEPLQVFIRITLT